MPLPSQKPQPNAPKKIRVHRAVYVISAILALTLFGDSLLYSVLPLYAPELGIPLGAVGVILSINRWIRLLTNPLASRMYSKFGLHRPLLTVVAASAASTFVYSRAWGTAALLAARSVWGLCWSHLRLGNFLVVLATSSRSIGTALGVHHAITRLGSGFTVVIGGALVDWLGYSRGLTIMAVLSLGAIPLFFYLMRILPHDPTTAAAARAGEQEAKDGKLHAPEFTLPFCFFGGFLISFAAAGVLTSTLSLILQQRLGSTVEIGPLAIGIATVSGLLFAVRWTSNLIVSPIVGYFSDRWGRRGLVLSLTVTTTGLLFLFAGTAAPLAAVLSAALLFFSCNALELILEAAAGDNAAQGDRSKIMSQYASFYDFGAASGPLIAYGMGTLWGFASPYYLAATLLLVLLAIGIRNKPNQ